MMLGNLSVDEIEKRTGVNFPDEIRVLMNGSHQPKAESVGSGQWHCFDIPFTLLCGDMETALKIYNSVKDRSGEFKQQLQIALSN